MPTPERASDHRDHAMAFKAQLRDNPYILALPTVAQATAETQKDSRRVHALIDDLEAVIGRERMVTLDNAVCELEGSIALQVSAYLVEALVAVNWADHCIFAAPSAGGGVS